MIKSLSLAAQTAYDPGNQTVKILLWKAIVAPLKELNLLTLFWSQVSKDLRLEIQGLGSKMEVFERGEKLTPPL